jgi:periplasmic protein CpxP/Spy
MKLRLIMLLSVIMGATTIAVAQGGGGGFQRQTPEQRVAAIHAKLDSAFKTPAAKLASLDTALTVLFKQQDERMQALRSGGQQVDRETMMAERKKYTDSRDEMIKATLTAEQFAIWRDTIEPSMRPQRPGGGGGGGNN